MIIVLLGYMTSGKSTIGKLLAEDLKYEFIDLDEYIEQKEQKTIRDIFKDSGEIYFRKIETQYLKEVITQEQNVVLSLGGGTPCYSNNMMLLQEADKVTSIYLKVSIPNIVKRLKTGKHQRPLVAHLNTEDELLEFVGKHLFERTQFYNLADTTITTDDWEVKDILEKIIVQLF